MFQMTFLREILLIAFFTFISGCADTGFHHTDESIDDLPESVVPPPKFQTENYLTAREKLLKNLVPEEQQAAVRIFDMMMEFMVEFRQKNNEPREILVRLSDYPGNSEYGTLPCTYVDVDIGHGQWDSIQLRILTIRDNHVNEVNFEVQAYSSCGCCYVSHFPKEYYQEFWKDIKKLTQLKHLDLGNGRLDQDEITIMIRDF